jgi:RNA polymerase sigma-70 factor (ECF subfamily)
MGDDSAVSPTPASSTSALSDEQLALGIQAGERQDLAALIERHHSPLLGYLFRLVNGDRPLAEDLVQETFLKLLKSIEQYQYPRPFKPWLYAIATNRARDHFKQADSRRTASVPDEPGFWQARGGQTGSLEQKLVARDSAVHQKTAVATALQSLPDHQREVVLLRYYQDFSLADISAALDIPLGTAKSRLSLATKRLRQIMENEE